MNKGAVKCKNTNVGTTAMFPSVVEHKPVGGNSKRGSENSVAPVKTEQIGSCPLTVTPDKRIQVHNNGVDTHDISNNLDFDISVVDKRCDIDAQMSEKVLLYDINGGDDEKFLNVTEKKFEDLLCFKGDTDIKLFNEWRSQSDFDFGFVPLSDFIMPNVDDPETVTDPFILPKLIKDSRRPNYLGCRIPVNSQFNLQAWTDMLVGYWDVQLPELLNFGRNYTLSSDKRNHSSAVQYQGHVDAYLREETGFGAILGPFTENPIDNCHYSPFLTREKSGSDKKRVIIDLSWPHGFFVNDGIDKNSYLRTDFSFTFPSVDNITSELTRLGTAAHLYKIDVSRAFRHVKLDPSDYDLLGLVWDDATYVDTCLPFGAWHGTKIFQRISDAIRFGMRQMGYSIINYVDDFIGVGTPSVVSVSYHCLLDLLHRLDLDISQKKLCRPSTKAVCLGVEIDTIRRTISVPEDKLRRICQIVDDWDSKHFCSVHQLQSSLVILCIFRNASGHLVSL